MSDAMQLLKDVVIKDHYPHEHSPSIFVMMHKSFQLQWCPSGNELRRIYLESPDDFLSGPIEVPIPKDLDKIITFAYDNY